ncbi:NUDIX domain-containing protein [Haloglycomyces albus]|uniref:NUDIX domain-containing protein n=1 Tax=Haloglycomyces albus TaxID=526067 RepID=UPI0012EBA6D9
MSVRQRVVSYVLRWSTLDSWEVLTFRHIDIPEAGVQVPGGGVDSGETIAEEALREYYEETGLDGVEFGEVLGTEVQSLSGTDWCEDVQASVFCLLFVQGTSSTEWRHIVSDGAGDAGLRFHCRFVAAERTQVDFGLEYYLPLALQRANELR